MQRQEVMKCLDLLASLGPTGRRRVVLGPTLNTQTLMKTDGKKKKILSKFMIFGGHIYSHPQPRCSLDTPETIWGPLNSSCG